MSKYRYPIVLCFIVVLLFAGVSVVGPSHPGVAWVASVVLLLAFVAVAGYSITGRWIGALIDERNIVSLSRFQMALWTCLLLSAFLAAALINLTLDHATALDIRFPPELWALMGISMTSLVGSPLILATKSNKPADAAETRSTIELLDEQGAGPTENKGQLIVNRDIASARWSDLFTGEEVGNAARLDLTRIQMFFFTVVTAIAYGVGIFYMFWTLPKTGIHELPALNQSLIALIGISHGGYLTAKAIPRSRDAAPGAATAAAAAGAAGVAVPDVADLHPPMG